MGFADNILSNVCRLLADSNYKYSILDIDIEILKLFSRAHFKHFFLKPHELFPLSTNNAR